MKNLINESLSGFFLNKRILITGVSGFIGSHLLDKLNNFQCKIICLSRNIDIINNTSNAAEIEFIKANYQDYKLIRKCTSDVDIIYHLASQTSIYEAEKDPMSDFEANVKPLQLILESCRKIKRCPIIIFPGTATQCGMINKLPVNESVLDKPITTYDFHKLQAENYLKFYINKKWVKGVSFRLTNVYGPGSNHSSRDRGILNLMVKKAINGEDITIYGSGKYIRDYIYIDDVIKTLVKAPIKLDVLNGKHFILGSGYGTSIKDAFNLISKINNEINGVPVKVKYTEPPAYLLKIEFRDFIADIFTLKQEGFLKDITTLDKGIQTMFNSY